MEPALARLFAYDHLPEHLQAISKPFHDLAESLMTGDQANEPLMRNALLKLWEAKNLVVVATARPA